MFRLVVPLCVAALLSLLVGCDQLGIESATAIAAQREGEGKAIGGGCRHAGRAIEDCYALNRKADKASVFAGWREMNDYMRENKIDPVAPQVAAGSPAVRIASGDEAGDDAKQASPDKPKADKADKLAKTAKADKPEKPDRSETAKVDKPQKTEKPDT